jgi:protein-S-isoprenylcysteine O-methyltransferase Ste14
MHSRALSFYVLPCLWLIFLLVWLFGAIGIKRTRVRDNKLGTVFQIAFGLSVSLVFNLRLGPLNQGFLPPNPITKSIGIALTAVGIGLAIWARFYLGRNWSAKVVIKEDHELIRRGPYARLRHPIYSGVMLGLFGTVLALDKWRYLLGFLLLVVYFCTKASREEVLLSREFGPAWEEHKKHSGFLLPKLN